MPFQLVIVTPEGQAFQGAVGAVVLPGTEGEFGVLPKHEPFLTGLRIGALEVTKADGEKLHAAVSRGFAEIHGDSVTVMVNSCEFSHEIDEERAGIARERARRQLEEMRATTEGETLYQDYQDSYSRAITRIAVSKKRG